MRSLLPRGVRLCATLAACLLSSLAPAQEATAWLEVVVIRDHAALAGAAVRLEGRGSPRTAKTDAQGTVVFPHLRAGRYDLKVWAPPLDDARELRIEAGTRQRIVFSSSPGERGPAGPSAERQIGDRGTSFSAEELRTAPRPADPWSVLRDVPGIVLDRVNVGGSETAMQSVLVSRGDAGAGAVWTLDGVDVTDPAALGFTTFYPDTDALAGVQVRTTALDVRVRTPGVQVGLHMREPEDRLAGAAHFRGAADAFQSDNLPPELEGRPFFRNRTEQVLEMGADAGGPVREGRLWLWGAASRRSLRQETSTEHDEELRLTTLTAKGRLHLGNGTLSVLALRGEKVHEDRDTGVSAARESRWRQSGPTHLLAAEDQRLLGGVSVLARLSYMDAGFRLVPPGGSAQNAFEDFRGVLRGSYASFDTDRRRLQAGLEAAGRRRWLGLDHDLLAGAGYRRSPVETRFAWPGNKVVGFERQSVFFRTFRLTGFALPTRDQHARSFHDHAELYVQDRSRVGRVTATVGARLDRLAGKNLASSVDANPVFPDLLPAVSYRGGGEGVGWLDLLPRLALSWDVTGRGKLVAGAGYAAYGAALGTGEITFDSPIGREAASLTYYWLDRNGDHAVQADELDTLRGRLGSSGVDPGRPASTSSPHAIRRDLRSPRTHELSASLDAALGGTHAAASFSWRRQVRSLWRPLRGLALGDYIIRGAVRGQLFGEEYSVGYFAPASESRIVPGSGRILSNREGYHQDSFSAEVEVGGRLGQKARWRAWGSFSDWRERFLDGRSIQDPTPLEGEPLQDAGLVAVRPGGLARGDVFVNARWTAGASLHGRLPGGMAGTALMHAREGFPIPYFEVASTGDPTGGAKNVLISPHLDSFRLPALILVDARLERGFRAGRGTLTLAADVFNLLNRSTRLQVARDIELPVLGRPREILRPRIVRLGLDYRF